MFCILQAGTPAYRLSPSHHPHRSRTNAVESFVLCAHFLHDPLALAIRLVLFVVCRGWAPGLAGERPLLSLVRRMNTPSVLRSFCHLARGGMAKLSTPRPRGFLFGPYLGPARKTFHIAQIHCTLELQNTPGKLPYPDHVAVEVCYTFGVLGGGRTF